MDNLPSDVPDVHTDASTDNSPDQAEQTAGNFTIKNVPHVDRKWLGSYARRHDMTMAEAMSAAVQALREKESRTTLQTPEGKTYEVVDTEPPTHVVGHMTVRKVPDDPEREQIFRGTRARLELLQEVIKLHNDIGEADQSKVANEIREDLRRELRGLRAAAKRTLGGTTKVIAFLFSISIAGACACENHDPGVSGASYFELVTVGCPIENAEQVI